VPKQIRKSGSPKRATSTARRRRTRPVDLSVDASRAVGRVLGELTALPPDDAHRLFPLGLGDVHVSVDPGGRVDIRFGSRSATEAANHTLHAGDSLNLGEKVPNRPEREVVGAATTVIRRGTPEFDALIRNTNPDVVFKDEEGTSADRMMTARLSLAIDALATLVRNEWSGTTLRVTEAWDENMEHGTKSVHYEARAADLTTFPIDGNKLGRLAGLAVRAGFAWVFFENALHLHVSTPKS